MDDSVVDGSRPVRRRQQLIARIGGLVWLIIAGAMLPASRARRSAGER